MCKLYVTHIYKSYFIMTVLVYFFLNIILHSKNTLNDQTTMYVLNTLNEYI